MYMYVHMCAVIFVFVPFLSLSVCFVECLVSCLHRLLHAELGDGIYTRLLRVCYLIFINNLLFKVQNMNTKGEHIHTYVIANVQMITFLRNELPQNYQNTSPFRYDTSRLECHIFMKLILDIDSLTLDL